MKITFMQSEGIHIRCTVAFRPSRTHERRVIAMLQ
jgi:hypothetical protein